MNVYLKLQSFVWRLDMMYITFKNKLEINLREIKVDITEYLCKSYLAEESKLHLKTKKSNWRFNKVAHYEL